MAVNGSNGVSAGRGHVSLDGAGPGDPGLLTRTAIARLISELFFAGALSAGPFVLMVTKPSTFDTSRRKS